MKEKRRDNKGRILHTGESQRTDGKYLYKYVDAFGNTKFFVKIYKFTKQNCYKWIIFLTNFHEFFEWLVIHFCNTIICKADI